MTDDFFTRLARRALRTQPTIRSGTPTIVGPMIDDAHQAEPTLEAEPTRAASPTAPLESPISGRKTIDEPLVTPVAAVVETPARPVDRPVASASDPVIVRTHDERVEVQASSHHEVVRPSVGTTMIEREFNDRSHTDSHLREVIVRPALSVPRVPTPGTVTAPPDAVPTTGLPSIEIRIGRLEIGEPRRGTRTDTSLTKERNVSAPRRAVALADYLAERDA